MASIPPIIIFGGTFDPIHNGHLQIANCCLQDFAPEVIRFLPCAQNVLKADAPIASDADRLKMLQLAIADQPRYQIDDREIRRGPPSYMIDSIESIRIELDNPIYLLMSTDSLAELTHWQRYRDLLQLTNLIITPRPGYQTKLPADVLRLLNHHQAPSLFEFQQQHHGLIWLHSVSDGLTIAATHIRETIRTGGNASQHLPPAVWQYIVEHKLYRNNASI